MYIRIQTPGLRYRITQNEAQRLLAGEVLSETVFFTASSKIQYTLKCTESESQFDYLPAENCLTFKVNRVQLSAELTGRPTKRGIVVHKHTDIKEPLQISLEIDLKDKPVQENKEKN